MDAAFGFQPKAKGTTMVTARHVHRVEPLVFWMCKTAIIVSYNRAWPID